MLALAWTLGAGAAYADDTAIPHLTRHATDLIPEEGQMGTFYLHPNTQGATMLGQLWGKAIEATLLEGHDP